MADPYAGVAALLGAFFIVFLIFSLVAYVYTSLAWMTIGSKLNHPRPWLAWIPLANIAYIFQLGGFHWAWAFLILGTLIPFLGILAGLALIVMTLISIWRVAEKRNFPGWTVLLTLVPVLGGLWGLVMLGILAWKD